MSIRELDDATIGQIAAGEIIDRPQSVVKELVENAVDAGATRVAVTLERGGLELIEVRDDGAGIAPDELPLALRRHATSKLAVARDLESIGTLGFRGEGLASIAAVARVELVSRTREAAIGSRVSAHAERNGPVEPKAAPVGTIVAVTGLFENVPVRREYLKSASTEFSRVSAWLSTFALGYPQVSFSLRHDGKDVWTMPATHDMRERLAMVFGKENAGALIALDDSAATTLDGNVRGYISAPGNDRGDRRLQTLFVNGRLLRSTLLAGAWTAAYTTFAMTGRHPYGVLFVDVPADHVDPNVHPQKNDVRLRYGQNVFDAVRRTMAMTLRTHATQRFSEATAPTVSLAPHSIDASLAHVESLFEMSPLDPDEVPQRRMRVLAQIHRTYVLATDGDALLLVDQHAAHERIAYELIVARAREQTASEPLLVPLVIELDAGQSEALERAIEPLREGGLEIESFGDRAYRITATPAGYRARAFDMRGFLADLTTDVKARDVRERIWASLACHSVTVAGERLETDEMTTLVERLQTCANPMHCPHGRPTMVRLNPDDLARLFKRL